MLREKNGWFTKRFFSLNRSNALNSSEVKECSQEHSVFKKDGLQLSVTPYFLSFFRPRMWAIA
jgi:hypothetical protein